MEMRNVSKRQQPDQRADMIYIFNNYCVLIYFVDEGKLEGLWTFNFKVLSKSISFVYTSL